MKNFNFLKSIEGRLQKGRKGHVGFGSGPYADWKIISHVFAFLIVGVVVASVIVFIKTDKGEIFRIERTQIEQENMLNIDLLREAISYYRAKEVEFNNILSNSPKATSTQETLPFGKQE